MLRIELERYAINAKNFGEKAEKIKEAGKH